MNLEEYRSELEKIHNNTSERVSNIQQQYRNSKRDLDRRYEEEDLHLSKYYLYKVTEQESLEKTLKEDLYSSLPTEFVYVDIIYSDIMNETGFFEEYAEKIVREKFNMYHNKVFPEWIGEPLISKTIDNRTLQTIVCASAFVPKIFFTGVPGSGDNIDA